MDLIQCDKLALYAISIFYLFTLYESAGSYINVNQNYKIISIFILF